MLLKVLEHLLNSFEPMRESIFELLGHLSISLIVAVWLEDGIPAEAVFSPGGHNLSLDPAHEDNGLF